MSRRRRGAHNLRNASPALHRKGKHGSTSHSKSRSKSRSKSYSWGY